ncbi:hypothetical protein [Haloarcula onubensis]|uniref:Uncharacterized protein n=1 Tax=Haloarcula onubensis TaxID=2950539 RepID=A0ABU2FKK0_9EURY|nr:hypothetical protein [Halomicroarcula sp. S3CR25-11]MDS0280954.1 hypothetical protein [Halomicroarcula sp. S3CR25-11]
MFPAQVAGDVLDVTPGNVAGQTADALGVVFPVDGRVAGVETDTGVGERARVEGGGPTEDGGSKPEA